MSTPTVTALSQPKYISDWESVGKNFSPEEAALLKTLTDAYEKRRRAGAVRALQNIPSGPLTGAVAAISPDTYANMAETELGGEAGTAASALEGLGMSAMGGVPASPALVEMLRIQGQKRNAPASISRPKTEAEKALSLKRAMKRAEEEGITFEKPNQPMADVDFIATPERVSAVKAAEALRREAAAKPAETLGRELLPPGTYGYYSDGTPRNTIPMPGEESITRKPVSMREEQFTRRPTEKGISDTQQKALSELTKKYEDNLASMKNALGGHTSEEEWVIAPSSIKPSTVWALEKAGLIEVKAKTDEYSKLRKGSFGAFKGGTTRYSSTALYVRPKAK